jgi:hypothetical protein
MRDDANPYFIGASFQSYGNHCCGVLLRGLTRRSQASRGDKKCSRAELIDNKHFTGPLMLM